jgi:hypothetical protein
MNNFRKLIALCILFTSFGNATNQNSQMVACGHSLEKDQEIFLEKLGKIYLIISIGKGVEFLLSIKPRDLFNKLDSVNDLYLALTFYSYGTQKGIYMQRNEIFTTARKNGQGEEIFDDIKDNFKKYLFQNLLKENDQEAVTQAIVLYETRFRTIWSKLVNSNLSSFDCLNNTFFYIQAEAGQDVYYLLEFEFSKFFHGFRHGDSRATDLHGE